MYGTEVISREDLRSIIDQLNIKKWEPKPDIQGSVTLPDSVPANRVSVSQMKDMMETNQS